MVDAPYAPIERPTDDIPEAPGAVAAARAPAMAADSVRDRTLFDRLAGLRIEPILGRLRPAAPPPVNGRALRRRRGDGSRPPARDPRLADDNPFTPDVLRRRAAAGSRCRGRGHDRAAQVGG